MTTHWNRFDIAEAYYLALSHCHGGQWSPEYARLCKLQTYFKPRYSLQERGVSALTRNGRAIYHRVYNRLLEAK